ncbi:MAG: VWA domain-containing protein [Acidobacteriota bacterium]
MDRFPPVVWGPDVRDPMLNIMAQPRPVPLLTRPFIRRFPLACILLISVTKAVAQTPTSEVTTRETAVTFSTRTNLVPVKVVIRDKDGRAVGGLTKADFELADNSKPQSILRFTAERNEAQTALISAIQTGREGQEQPNAQIPAQKPPAAIPERYIMYLFDDIHTEFADLIRAREAAIKQMERVIDPSTRVAVYTVSGQTRLDFTDDLAAVRKTVASVHRFSASQVKEECPSIDYYLADQIVNQNDMDVLAMVVNEAEGCGIKLPNKSEEETFVRQLAKTALNRGQHESLLGLNALDVAIRRLATMPGSRSVIYVSEGFFLSPEIRGDEGHLFDRAILAGVVLNALDARGLYTGFPGGDVSRPALPSNSGAMTALRTRIERDRALATTDVMAAMANATGGSFFWNDNGYEQGFELLAGSPEYTYVLAFSPSDLKSDGKFHTLRVRLTGASGKYSKDLEVIARKGYYAPSADADAAETVQEEIHEAVFSREETSEIPLDLSLQYFKLNDLSARVTVIAKLDVTRLKFRKGTSDDKSADPAASSEPRNLDTVTVVSVVFDRNGNFVKGLQRVVDMKLRDQTLQQLTTQGAMSVRTSIDLEPGSYLVRLVVRDGEGKTMATRNGNVEIPFE